MHLQGVWAVRLPTGCRHCIGKSFLMVQVVGFEPTTTAIQTRDATRLHLTWMVWHRYKTYAMIWRKRRELNAQGLCSTTFEMGAVTNRLALPYDAFKYRDICKTLFLCRAHMIDSSHTPHLSRFFEYSIHQRSFQYLYSSK